MKEVEVKCGDCDGTGKFWSPLVGWVEDDICGWCRGTGKAMVALRD